MIFVLDID